SFARVCAADKLPKAAVILQRIAQAVDMIDAQTLHAVFRYESGHKLVHGTECARVFDADAGEVVDIEKAPIVDRRYGNAPIREAIMLTLEQPVQDREAGVRPIGRQAARD